MVGGIGGRRRRGRQRMKWLDSITDLIDVSLSERQELVMDREVWRAAIHWVAKSRTWLSDWTELNWTEWLAMLSVFFMCLFAIHISSLERCLFKSFWVVWALCIFWLLTPYWLSSWQILSPIPYVDFGQWVPLLCKDLSLIRSHLFIFAFVFLPWETDLRKYYYNLWQWIFCLHSLLRVL